MNVQTQSYGAFSESLHRQVVAARTPLNGAIEVTRRCPLACVHCYNNLPMRDRGAQLGELTTAEHRRILDEMAEVGCLWLLYTGGEIFARPDFLEIYTHAKRNGFLVTLFTNGILIDEAVADHLLEWRPFAVEITMYGRTRETYERVTGVAGSFDRCMRGIDLVLERGLPLKLKTVAVAANSHEVCEMRRFAGERGVEFRFDALLSPRIDCSKSPLGVRLVPEDCVELDMRDPPVVAAWKEFAEQFLRPVHPPEASDQLYHCGGGVDSFAVNPYGEMSICVLSQADRYDLRAGAFREGWELFLRRVRDDKKITRPTKCVYCELKAMCGMCPANGELENGDPEAPVDFLCQVAHLRAYAFDLPVQRHGDCEYCAGGAGYARLMDGAARLRIGSAYGPREESESSSAAARASGGGAPRALGRARGGTPR